LEQARISFCQLTSFSSVAASENKTRFAVGLSSFHSVLIEMKQQGFLRDDPAAAITIRPTAGAKRRMARSRSTDQEMKDIYAVRQNGSQERFRRKCWARYRPVYLAGFTGMGHQDRGLPGLV
jgi:hypothetical protein